MLAAYTYRRNYPFEGGRLEQVTASGPQPEHRILEELKVKHKLTGLTGKPIKFSHRFRLEQRFEGTSTEGIGTTSWDFVRNAHATWGNAMPPARVTSTVVGHEAVRGTFEDGHPMQWKVIYRRSAAF